MSGPLCGAPAVDGPCILPRAHNMGKADVPSNHRGRADAPPVEPDPWRPRNEAEEAIAAERMWEHANTGASGPILNSDEFYGRSPDPVAGLRLDNGLAQDLSRTTTVSHGAWMKWFAHCPDPSAFAALLASDKPDREAGA